MKSERGDLPAHASTAETKKKQYITPELVVHGSVEKITEQDGTGTQQDQPMGQARFSQ
jgi:hypothetical protein